MHQSFNELVTEASDAHEHGRKPIIYEHTERLGSISCTLGYCLISGDIPIPD